MAITLKLKGPRNESKNDESRLPAIQADTPAILLPKIKIKPPSVLDYPSKRTKVSDENKHNTLKISLGKKSNESAAVDPSKIVHSVPRVRVKATRIPGEGYDLEAPGIEDDLLLEQAIAVRFLDDANLDTVQHAVASGDLSTVNLKWITREKAVFNISGTFYSARLVDLPTLTEIFKTTDKKNIFKALDTCQLLLVLKVINPTELDTERDFTVPLEYTFVHPLYKLLAKGEIKQRHTLVRDGLTSPFVDVIRRFKPRKASHRVLEDIDARVRELIKLDDEAEESHFEVVNESQVANKFNHTRRLSTVNTQSHLMLSEPRNDQLPGSPYTEMEVNSGIVGELEDAGIDGDNIEMNLEEELNQMFGDEDEGDIEDEQAMCLGEEDGPEGDHDDEDEEDEDEDEEEDDEAKADRQHAKLLENEVAELEKVVQYHQKNFANATSKMMRMKFQNTYTSLKASLDQKKRILAKHYEDQENLIKKSDPTKLREQRVAYDEDDEDEDDEEDGGGKEFPVAAESGQENADQMENLDGLEDLF